MQESKCQRTSVWIRAKKRESSFTGLPRASKLCTESLSESSGFSGLAPVGLIRAHGLFGFFRRGGATTSPVIPACPVRGNGVNISL
jgi:hypothetical protein